MTAEKTAASPDASTGKVESEVLAAVRAYAAAMKAGDIDRQVAFFGAQWAANSGMTQAGLKAQLEEQRAQEGDVRKWFVLDDAQVTVDDNRATVDPAVLRSATGGGNFEIQLAREADGVWRCLSIVGSKRGHAPAENARRVREGVLEDPARPGFHIAMPEGVAMPFDPNGAIYWKGRYHLFYIFQDTRLGKRADHWGHLSSRDLLHWRHHPTGLVDGMYSGNCFLNHAGVPTICYHQRGQGNALAVALDDDLDAWQKLDSNPITPVTRPGDPHHGKYTSWDPFGWLEGDTYYAIFGGKRPGVAKRKAAGGPWQYVADLFAHAAPGVSLREDVSCPDFFRLGGKDVLLCISHRLGCRYYVGEWKGEQFHPSLHARMSWVDHSFFAPESLLDEKGRRIMWAWIMDEPQFGVRAAHGWSGTMSLPRVLTLGEDDTLRMDVPAEFETLRYAPFERDGFALSAGAEMVVDGISGNSLELAVEMEGANARAFGVKVLASPDGSEETSICYDATRNLLKVDTRKAGPDGTPKAVEAAPFTLRAGERLKLRVFVDKSVVEVFANGRQAVARRVYPARPVSVGVRLFAMGGDARVHRFAAWRMSPANPW